MSGHTNHSQKHQSGAVRAGVGPFCILLREFAFSHLTHFRAMYQKVGYKLERNGIFLNSSDSAFYFLAGNFTAKQYWLRLHTGIVFVACYNELVEHQEVLGTIRACYNSNTITLQIGSSLLIRS